MAQKPRKPAPRRKVKKAGKGHLGLWVLLALVGLMGLYGFALDYSRPHVTGDKLTLSQFVDDAAHGRIKNATLLDADSYVIGTYKRPNGSTGPYNSPYLQAGLGDLTKLLLANNVDTTVDQQTNKKTVQLAGYLLPGFILILLFSYLIISYRRGSGLFKVRSGARRAESAKKGEAPRVTFADVAGQPAAIAELKEIGQFLSDPDRFSRIGAQIPKGILLYGPPGCGKTLLARALAAEEGAAFFSISGSDFIEVYVGVGAARVRDLFREARENAPSVIFIDELDSIGRRRGGATGGTMGSHPEQEQALNAILTEMDGFSTSDGIIVVGATNRPDVLDPALLRPGRFDRSVGLERPDEQGRLDILKIHARGKTLAPDASLAAVARRTVGLNGADLANVMNEAALLGARAGGAAITQVELDTAIGRILDAPDRQKRLSMRDRGFGRSVPIDDHRVTFADIAGQDAAVAELREIEQFLTEPGRYAAVGASIPRGVLLYGPPGSGKTLLARALAAEANASFYSVTATEFVEVFSGEGAARVRDLFAEARSTPPAILFIDEFDAVAGRRGGGAGPVDRYGGVSERNNTLNQILTEMDGFTPSSGVIVIGSTNRPDALDPAVLRPGRFDRTVGLERPDEKGRLDILRLHARGKVLGPDVVLERVARRATGLNGADLSNILNEAALLTARDAESSISQAKLDLALDRILEAPDRQRRLSIRDRSFGRSYTTAEDRVTFADVAGADDAIAELAEFRQYLTEPERFETMGARVPRGVLLVGPPGCGKTLLAKAVAGETNAAFFSVAATEFVEVYVGEGAGRVRDLFAEAKSMAPSILFIDEIDAIGGRRSSRGGHAERENTLNQILVELDGFSPRTGVIIMAATNRPDLLDPALVRPGRFDRQVTIDLPDHRGRLAILEMYARRRKVAPDVDLNGLAGVTAGSSGADLANLVNEAALLAARQGLPHLTRAVLDEALDRAFLGVASRGNVMTAAERRIVAYHEAGHALVTRALPGAGTLHKVSAATRGHALGLAWNHEDSDRVVYTRSAFIDKIAALLGGRVAEELIFQDPGSGASSDIRYATQLARKMVREYGMGGSLGLIAYTDELGPDGRNRPYSEDTAAKVDGEVRTIVDEAYRLSRQVLERSRAALDAVAQALIEREVLTGADVDGLAAARQFTTAPNGQLQQPLTAPHPVPPPSDPVPG